MLMELFFFLCDVYLGFFLLVALVYLNPGFLYEKKTMPKTQTCLCFSFCFVTGTCLCYRHILVVILLSADSILSLYLVSHGLDKSGALAEMENWLFFNN